MMGDDTSQVSMIMTNHEHELTQFRSALSDASAVVDKFRHEVTDGLAHELNARIPAPMQVHSVPVPIADSSTPRQTVDNTQPAPPIAPRPLSGGSLSAVSLNPTHFKDIVIGMAQDTDPRNLAVFCASLREVKPDIELVLFINTPIPASHKEVSRKYNVNVIPFNLGRLSMEVEGESVGIAPGLQKYHPSTTRWSLMYSYFKVSLLLCLRYETEGLLLAVCACILDARPMEAVQPRLDD